MGMETYQVSGEAVYADSEIEDMPELHQAEARLAEAIGALDISLNDLERHLERVLRPETPRDLSDAKLLEVREPRAQLTDFVHAQAARVEIEVARVNDFIRRIAL